MMATNQLISDRAQLLLKALVRRYIREGQPVGSRALVEESGLSVSSATVRNIMGDLEALGLIRAPHTSAGRVPTAQGYRFFVDTLITMQPLEQLPMSAFELELNRDKSSRELVASASQLLSRITSQAGLVTLPLQERLTLRQVEFLPLSDNRVLVILVMNEREVQNRVIHTRRPYTQIELTQAANLINQRYAGTDLNAVRRAIVEAMADDKSHIDHYLQMSLDLASQALEGDSEPARDYVVAGETQLLGSAAPEELDKLRDLFDAFQRKRDILELVDRCIQADGVQIFIGEEAGYEVLGDFSVITAPYRVGNERLGVIGVVGPTRMAYDRVIPIVDVTARMLSRALQSL